MVCYQKDENNRKTILEDADCEEEKPESEQPCLLEPCEGVDWVVSDWEGVSLILVTKNLPTGSKDKSFWAIEISYDIKKKQMYCEDIYGPKTKHVKLI